MVQNLEFLPYLTNYGRGSVYDIGILVTRLYGYMYIIDVLSVQSRRWKSYIFPDSISVADFAMTNILPESARKAKNTWCGF